MIGWPQTLSLPSDTKIDIQKDASGYDVEPWTNNTIIQNGIIINVPLQKDNTSQPFIGSEGLSSELESTSNIDNKNESNSSNNLIVIGTKFTDTATKADYIVTNADASVAYAGTTNKNATSVTIPSTVKINGTSYKVTSVSNSAFKNNKKLSKVTVSGNVTSIGASAFQGCTALKTVKLGSKVTTVGRKAFYGCKKLSSLTLGKNLSSIGSSAFQNCTALKKVSISSKVKKIGSKAFYNCKKLNLIAIKTKKLTAKTVGSKAFTKAGSSNYKKLTVKVPSGKYKKYITILKKRGVSVKAKTEKG